MLGILSSKLYLPGHRFRKLLQFIFSSSVVSGVELNLGASYVLCYLPNLTILIPGANLYA